MFQIWVSGSFLEHSGSSSVTSSSAITVRGLLAVLEGDRETVALGISLWL